MDLIKTEYAINDVFNDLSVFFKKRHIGFYGYYKAIEGDLYKHLLQRLEQFPFEKRPHETRKEVIQQEVNLYFSVTYPHLSQVLAQTNFRFGEPIFSDNSESTK